MVQGAGGCDRSYPVQKCALPCDDMMTLKRGLFSPERGGGADRGVRMMCGPDRRNLGETNGLVCFWGRKEGLPCLVGMGAAAPEICVGS